MEKNKTLPPTPLRPSKEAYPETYSPEAYARILEEENEQLRLRNQQLVQRKNDLELQVAQHEARCIAISQKLDNCRVELNRRDETISELASTIVAAFQRYTESVDTTEEGGEIPICYSYFHSDSA